jgi:hypothetical protein
MKQEQAFSSKTIRRLLDTHRRITEIKYLYLKIVQSHSVKEPAKAELKGLIIDLAASLNRFFNDLRFKSINKFNIDEVEKSIESFINTAGKQFRKVRKSGLKLASARVHMDRIPAGEGEIDAALLTSRVFEGQALEKDKLDQLNAIKSYLVEATGGAEKVKAKKAAPTDRELLGLKIRNFEETLAGCEASNLDILYKVRLKVDSALQKRIKINVLAGARSEPGVLNHNELYVHDHGNGNFSISFRDAGIGFLLEILLVRDAEGRPPVYRGEISGWAETGPNRVNFLLRDRLDASRVELRDTQAAGAVSEFLRRAEMEPTYLGIRQACTAKEGETDRLRQRVEREIKQRVSEALDEAL